MRVSRSVALFVAASLALAGFSAQRSLRGEDPAPKADAKTAKPRAKPRGRLPAHYGDVVDAEQREKIYGIQQSYQPQIAALQSQLAALREKQTAEIEAVLRPEQLEKVKQLAAAAKAKRAKTTDGGDAGKEAAEEAKSADEEAPASDAKPDAKPAATKAKKAS